MMSDLTIDEIPPGSADPALKGSAHLLSRYLGPQWRGALLLAVLLLAGISLQLINPQVIRYFLDKAQSGGSSRALMLAAALFIGFALAREVFNVLTTYVGERVSWTATNSLRRDLALHCLRLDLPFHKTHTPGELIERIDGDVFALANFFSRFIIQVLASVLLMLGILALLFREDLRVGLALTLYVAAALVLLSLLPRLAVPRWQAERQASAELFGFLEERLSGAEEIRAVGAQAHALRGLHLRMSRLLQTSRSAFLFGSLVYNLTELLFAIGLALGLALGVGLYLRGEATIGAAYLIVFYIGMLAEPLQSLRAQVEDLQLAAASLGRVQELLSRRPQVRPPAAAERKRLPSGALPVEFRDISFQYEPESRVLEGVSFHLPAGGVLGVLGRTGSGKTTLTRLLFRLYDPAGGSIQLGGIDLRQLPLETLRGRVGLVTQDVQLFGASLRDNLTFFDHRIQDEQIAAALHELQLWEWVQSLPRGIDTPLSPGGAGLSAGEAQLLAFGRVFLKDPGLVVLDEASSRLDPATEALLEQAVDRLFARRTGIVIAHRLHTVQRADSILILEGGRVVEFGPREDLAGDPSSRFSRLLQTGLEEVLA